jgi:hypothetical protein
MPSERIRTEVARLTVVALALVLILFHGVGDIVVTAAVHQG